MLFIRQQWKPRFGWKYLRLGKAMVPNCLACDPLKLSYVFI